MEVTSEAHFSDEHSKIPHPSKELLHELIETETTDSKHSSDWVTRYLSCLNYTIEESRSLNLKRGAVLDRINSPKNREHHHHSLSPPKHKTATKKQLPVFSSHALSPTSAHRKMHQKQQQHHRRSFYSKPPPPDFHTKILREIDQNGLSSLPKINPTEIPAGVSVAFRGGAGAVANNGSKTNHNNNNEFLNSPSHQPQPIVSNYPSNQNQNQNGRYDTSALESGSESGSENENENESFGEEDLEQHDHQVLITPRRPNFYFPTNQNQKSTNPTFGHFTDPTAAPPPPPPLRGASDQIPPKNSEKSKTKITKIPDRYKTLITGSVESVKVVEEEKVGSSKARQQKPLAAPRAAAVEGGGASGGASRRSPPSPQQQSVGVNGESHYNDHDREDAESPFRSTRTNQSSPSSDFSDAAPFSDAEEDLTFNHSPAAPPPQSPTHRRPERSSTNQNGRAQAKSGGASDQMKWISLALPLNAVGPYAPRETISGGKNISISKNRNNNFAENQTLDKNQIVGMPLVEVRRGRRGRGRKHKRRHRSASAARRQSRSREDSAASKLRSPDDFPTTVQIGNDSLLPRTSSAAERFFGGKKSQILILQKTPGPLSDLSELRRKDPVIDHLLYSENQKRQSKSKSKSPPKKPTPPAPPPRSAGGSPPLSPTIARSVTGNKDRQKIGTDRRSGAAVKYVPNHSQQHGGDLWSGNWMDESHSLWQSLPQGARFPSSHHLSPWSPPESSLAATLPKRSDFIVVQEEQLQDHDGDFHFHATNSNFSMRGGDSNQRPLSSSSSPIMRPLTARTVTSEISGTSHLPSLQHAPEATTGNHPSINKMGKSSSATGGRTIDVRQVKKISQARQEAAASATTAVIRIPTGGPTQITSKSLESLPSARMVVAGWSSENNSRPSSSATTASKRSTVAGWGRVFGNATTAGSYEPPASDSPSPNIARKQGLFSESRPTSGNVKLHQHPIDFDV